MALQGVNGQWGFAKNKAFVVVLLLTAKPTSHPNSGLLGVPSQAQILDELVHGHRSHASVLSAEKADYSF